MLGLWGAILASKPVIARSITLFVGCASLGGCFFYDSTWGQAKASQKRVAAHEMPKELRTEPSSGAREGPGQPSKPVERLRIRAYATPHYAAALVDGQAQFEQALRDANPTLAHDLAFHLELTDYRIWSSNVSDDDLSSLIAAIQKDDSAVDVDWVVILASPRHMVAVSPDQIGSGQLLGRYLAIRAMSDADEFDAIERDFTELAEQEKAKLYAARKRHKAAAVLLHELGHTLGMPHELDQHSMMSPRYSPEASAFSAYAARLGQRVLALRATTAGTELHRSDARAALNLLRSVPAHTWEGTTAAEVEALLRFEAERPLAGGATVRRRASPSSSTALPSPPPGEPAAGSPARDLSATDRALLAQARAAQAGGRFVEARSLAAPLFQAYPDDYAVQELRCQLAMKVGLSMDDESAECERLRQLSGSGL